jgi:cation/acetate symporter
METQEFLSLLGKINPVAIAFFAVFISATLGVTYFAARKTKSTSEFFTAGGNITAWQNGFALAGDYMSAASFLGIAGMVALSGFDGLIYSIGFLVGWPVVLFFLAEPLRNLGKFTFADVVAVRFSPVPIRISAAISGLSVIAFYLIAQMVGAGSLIHLMFGISYQAAVLIVGVVMILYVLFGGMIATTWVQIIKACLLLAGATFLAVLVLVKIGGSPFDLFAQAVEKYPTPNPLVGAKLIAKPFDLISLGVALVFGTAGLPHILMRFYTVKSSKCARLSVFYATGLIGWFYLVTFILGFGACVIVGREAITQIDKGGNMAAIALSYVLGGSPLMGFISAVAFATILAVVAGLTLSGAAAVSHDLWVHVFRSGHSDEGEQFKVARVATLLLGILAMVLGISFEGQNVAFMVGLAFSIAASGNFPVLVMAIFMRRFTTAGAVTSMIVGTAASLLLIWFSPTVQIDILKHESALFPFKNPALVSVPLSFLCGIVVSLITYRPENDQKYRALEKKLHLGD